MKDKRLETVVEIICQRGCRYVNSVLDDEAVRADCLELSSLQVQDQELVLVELKAVMKVYDKTGSCEI